MSKAYLRRGGNTIVLAEQLTPENADALAHWCNGVVVEEIDPEDESNRYVGINVPSFDGAIRVSEGAYLVYDRRLDNFSAMSKTAFEMLHKEA